MLRDGMAMAGPRSALALRGEFLMRASMRWWVRAAIYMLADSFRLPAEILRRTLQNGTETSGLRPGRGLMRSSRWRLWGRIIMRQALPRQSSGRSMTFSDGMARIGCQ